MKKHLIIAVLSIILLLCSCGDRGKTADYSNFENGCVLDGTFYDIYLGYKVRRWNRDYETVEEGLCRDPLCTHDGRDSLCPDNEALFKYSIVTDGEKLYLHTLDLNPHEEEGLFCHIFSIDPDGGNFTQLYSHTGTSNNPYTIQVDNGWLYYAQAYYNDDYDPGKGVVTSEDQYMNIMRMKTTGGKPEVVIGEKLSVGCSFFLDKTRYYLLLPDGSVKVTERESGREQVIPAETFCGTVLEILRLGDRTFLSSADPVNGVCPTEGGGEHECSYNDRYLYEYRDGAFIPVVERASWLACDNSAVYYGKESRIYLGTRDEPTGRPGETAPIDYFETTLDCIYCIDLADGGVTEYLPGKTFLSGGNLLNPYAADSGLFAYAGNRRNAYEGTGGYHMCRIVFGDGTFDVEKYYN